jgi:predicted Na+-dependent transporter
MNRALSTMLLAFCAAPAVAFLVYRLARGLGFLERPADKQHEYRRTIVVALYALLLFLPVLFFGFEKGWPRAWILFGIAAGLVLAVCAAVGVWSGIALWRLRHPDSPEPEPSPASAHGPES